MRSFAWSWIVALSLFGGGGLAPESGPLVGVEEQEALRTPEGETRLRRKTLPAPALVAPVAPPAPVRIWARLPASAPDVGVWISRRHERSPTA
jgi:hypothetical protein